MEEFLKFESAYSDQNNKIAKEFKRKGENTYLDHAGATLYSEIQIQNVFRELSTNLYDNPHSMNMSGKLTEDAVDLVRYRILDHFNTNDQEYSVVFTSGATAALKTIAECFDYRDNGTLAYLQHNHTSVLGMRCFSEHYTEVKIEDAFELYSTENIEEDASDSGGNGLFVYPAQCNFSGTKFPLSWIEKTKKRKLNKLLKAPCKQWYVVLDCACYVSTNELDLSLWKPDFVCISFYKLFGYPTGLGALLVKKTSEEVLVKKYFGGGTVQMALSSQNVMIPRNRLYERFEDGTLPFLSILAVKHGFDTINRLDLSFDLISKHVFSLAQYTYRNLIMMHHANGQPVAELYHDTVFDNRSHQGGIVNFNLLRPNGEYIGYSEVLHMANLHHIHLRVGCFCNPGACQRSLKLQTNEVIKHYKAGHVCGDQRDLIDGYPTGSARISFGYMSTKEEADKFLKMIETCFVDLPMRQKYPRNWKHMNDHYQRLFKISGVQNTTTKPVRDSSTQSSKDIVVNNTVSNSDKSKSNVKENKVGTLQQILLYPIKSCGAFSASESWELTPKGLKFDREWMIVNSSGVCLTQKYCKRMCLLKPEIDCIKKRMKLKFKGFPDAEIQIDELGEERKKYLCQSKVCGDRVLGWDCGDVISDWLSECLEIPGLRLLRQCDSDEYSEKDSTGNLSFANKAQYLLINSTSVSWLLDQIPEENFTEDINTTILRFRPNFVVDLRKSFAENDADEFVIGKLHFKVAGNCTRCQMICINQETGESSKEPLATLSREFKGKVNFGIYLNLDVKEDVKITIGSDIIRK
ncbi:unnamed protein product [Callosobruchus maculatus]|uniref:Molybdenum cofactor sulfurase n=1 Tax=Callosobruchus maculatus TaxID=64391 RepID=A0A653D7U2_CALMS|nr:unnamed protein product [Callosobruchus maculatus]